MEYPLINVNIGEKIPSSKGKSYVVTDGNEYGYKGLNHLLGYGGSSEVYLARDEYLSRLVAIKLFYPKYQLDIFPDIENALDRQDIKSEYVQEIESLCGIKHKNIIRLLDADSFTMAEIYKLNAKVDVKIKARKKKGEVGLPNGFRVWYIVNEFVPGVVFSKYLDEYQYSKKDLVDILVQVASAIDYIHREKCILHCDIKGSNILVDPERVDATLIDFALARNLNFEKGGVDENEKIKLFGYKNNFPVLSKENPLYGILNDVNRDITRCEFKKYAFPRLDIYHFGVLLKKCLLNAVFNENDKFYLNMVVRRCQDFEWQKWWYKSMSDVVYDIEKLLPDYESPHRIRSLGESIRGKHIIQLPNHFISVHMSEKVRGVVDTPYFQRLRTMYQLDLCHITFPGATHTRFLHSLHTYQLMAEFLMKLASDRVMRMYMSEKFVDLSLFSALLHDIFHFPFLHVMEEIGGVVKKGDNCLTEIELVMISNIGDKSLNDTICDLGVDVDDLWGIINRWSKINHEKENLLIHSMIDAGVDLDKISYLYFDSYYTGVPDGIGLDLNKLIRSSLITSKEPHVLAWKMSGLSPVEQVIMARYQMFKKVYWNSDNRSIIARVKYVFAKLFFGNYLTIKEYVEKTMFYDQMRALAFLNDEYKNFIKDYSPIEGIVLPKRELMIAFPTRGYVVDTKIRRYDIPEDDELIKYEGDKILELSDMIARNISEEFNINVNYGEVIVDAPGRKVDKIGCVPIISDEEEVIMLDTLSGPVKSLNDTWQRHVKRVRIFISDRVVNCVGYEKIKNYLKFDVGW